MCTSLQKIVTGSDRQNIEQLFMGRKFARFELRDFYSHPLFQQSEQFHFFLDILEQWNRKTEQLQLSNSYTLYYKNVYIYDNLRNAILNAQPHLVLQKLSLWYNTRKNKVRLIQKKQKQQVDYAWEIRNAFKSNLPAEIDQYRRRLFYNFSDKQNAIMKSELAEPRHRKVKTQCEASDSAQREQDEGRLTKIENEIIRFEREKKELEEAEARWKVKKTREQEFTAKNFYNAAFSSSKAYFSSRQKHEPGVTHPILKRSQTSREIRYSKTAFFHNRMSEAPNLTSKFSVRKSEDKTEKFDDFEVNQMRLSDVVGLNLLVNPNQKRLKKGKRR